MMNCSYIKTLLVLLICNIWITSAFSQENPDSLLAELEKEIPQEKFVNSMFKSTRLINFHTVEILGKKALDFRISHRFGDINSGADNLYGLDGPATIRLGLEYSHNGRLMGGIGRSSSGKYVDGFLKYRILRQTITNSMPISITAVGSVNVSAAKVNVYSLPGVTDFPNFVDRIAYMSQVIIGRKFNEHLSLQLTPTLIHYNMVAQIMDRNNVFAVIGAGRYKVSRSISITGEYALRTNKYSLDFKQYHNNASIGIDIETGGHVFQIFVTNSAALNEVQVISFTNTSWKDGGARLGFNISRVFGFGKKKKKW